ncbi:hypothetical protein MKK75_05680 [Methylobacterium sp. J-030]|uniref:hypothetical protein n=1 Tax=Methylobacterium sp. J-030 TaxID=2836627 RepID=UPI001FBA143D|nr:hypothetical protein [Methylobacterium sp. J-030]MCJ2068302.1 hypothetical protein [Methylobacterium sp. J-030]
MSWHGIDFELLCWSQNHRFGPTEKGEEDAFCGLAGCCGERTSTGRFVASIHDLPFHIGSPDEEVRALDGLARRGLLRWSREEPNGPYTIELLPGSNPPVTQDQALDQALRTLSRLRPDARIQPAAVRLLLMVAWRCRQRYGQIFQADELIRAAELSGSDDLDQQLDLLERCEALLAAPYPVEGCVQIGLLFD